MQYVCISFYASGCVAPTPPSCFQSCSGFVMLHGELTHFKVLPQILGSDLASQCCLEAITLQLWLYVRDSCHVDINLASCSSCAGCSRSFCWIVLCVFILLSFCILHLWSLLQRQIATSWVIQASKDLSVASSISSPLSHTQPAGLPFF